MLSNKQHSFATHNITNKRDLQSKKRLQRKSIKPRTNSCAFSSSSSTLSLFLQKSSMPQIPLDQKFPLPPSPLLETKDPILKGPISKNPLSTPVVLPIPAQSQHKILSSYRQTSLGRGLAISTTQTNPMIPKSTISLTLDLGSRYEHPEFAGMTHFLSHTIFRSTRNRTTGSLFRDMAKLGVELISDSNREHFTLLGTTANERITPILGTMWDLLTNHAFEFQDLLQDVGYYRELVLPRIHSNNLIQFQQTVHQAAYGNTTLGNPLYMSSNDDAFINGKFDRKALKNWSELFFTANRISLNAVNVNHSSIMSVLEKQVNYIPNTTIQHFPTAHASYVAKQSHLTHRSALYLPDSKLEQHIGLAYLAPNRTHQDYATAQVINTMLSTGFIYDPRGQHVSNPQSPYRIHNTRNSRHHFHKAPFEYQLNSNFHQYQDNNPLDNDQNDSLSRYIQQFDTTYLPYNDSGLMLLHTTLSTPSTSARNDSIDMMRQYIQSHSTLTSLPKHIIEHHKTRLLFNMLNYFSSNQVNLSTALSSYLSTKQFNHRAELIEQGKANNIISSQLFKWDPYTSHDPIDLLYSAIQKVTPDDVQRVLTNIINSPPTIVSYTAAHHHE